MSTVKTPLNRLQEMPCLFMSGSLVLLRVGTIALANNHIDSWGWIVMLPVSVVMLYLLLGT